MSIRMAYQRITPEQLSALRSDPEFRIAFFGEDGETIEADEERRLYLDLPDEISEVLNGDVDEGSGPLWDAVMGGADLVDAEIDHDDEFWFEELQDERCLTPDQVQDTAAALGQVRAGELRERFEAMQERLVMSIVASPANRYRRSRADEEECFRDLQILLEDLTAFFQRAAEAGEAMLVRRV